MKTVFAYASVLKEKKGGYFTPYTYYKFLHPVMEWVNILKADCVGNSIYCKQVKWDDYDLAMVFAQSDSTGSAHYLRSIAPHLKIITLPEPPPTWYISQTRWGWATRMLDDFNSSDLVIIGQNFGGLLQKFQATFPNVNNIHFIPLPFNIREYGKYINWDDRHNIIAITCHCNYLESSIRSWKVLQDAIIHFKGRWRTRVFYGEPSQWSSGTPRPEVMPFIWDTDEHIKRMNQCKILVDDNISPSSGHMVVEMASLHIPSVGSNDYIHHIFPEFCAPYDNHVKRHLGGEQMVDNVIRLANDESFYKQTVGASIKRLHDYCGYKICRNKLMELLRTLD